MSGLTSDPHVSALARAYLLAKQRVIAAGFESEIAWQEAVRLDDVDAVTFVREAAWVVLCAGMRESIVRARFERISHAFELWDPGHITRNSRRCCRRAREVFNHRRKIDAIVRIANQVVALGMEQIVEGIECEGPAFLTRFPYIGTVTCFHLAKNLGVQVAKPDRHLERMAAALGYAGASSLCGVISDALDEPIAVVDLVMWRFATIDEQYLAWLRDSTAHAPRTTWSTPSDGYALS